MTTTIRIRRASAEAFEVTDWRSGHASIQAQRLTPGAQVEHALEILCEPDSCPARLTTFIEIQTEPRGDRVRIPVTIDFQSIGPRPR